jgi:hypothetical protein
MLLGGDEPPPAIDALETTQREHTPPESTLTEETLREDTQQYHVPETTPNGLPPSQEGQDPTPPTPPTHSPRPPQTVLGEEREDDGVPSDDA